MLELFYGRGSELVADVALPVDADGVAALTWQELQILARRVVAELPGPETEIVTNAVPSTATENGLEG